MIFLTIFISDVSDPRRNGRFLAEIDRGIDQSVGRYRVGKNGFLSQRDAKNRQNYFSIFLHWKWTCLWKKNERCISELNRITSIRDRRKKCFQCMNKQKLLNSIKIALCLLTYFCFHIFCFVCKNDGFVILIKKNFIETSTTLVSTRCTSGRFFFSFLLSYMG